jgi:hypothetical protein
MTAAITGFLFSAAEEPTEVYRVGLNTNRLLLALGDLLIGWLLTRQAEVALARLDESGITSGGSTANGGDTAFYAGKIAAARFFTTTVLPRLAVERQLTEETTLDLMEVPEEAF